MSDEIVLQSDATHLTNEGYLARAQSIKEVLDAMPIEPLELTLEEEDVLGRALFERLEQLDPCFDGITWDTLDEGMKQLYMDGASTVIDEARARNLFGS